MRHSRLLTQKNKKEKAMLKGKWADFDEMEKPEQRAVIGCGIMGIALGGIIVIIVDICVLALYLTALNQ